jgi:glycine/D-amino acid oxidase-like deaminating enzyme
MPLEHAWYGRIAMTDDHIPKILSLGPDGYAVFGYSGRGISPGTTFGRAIANALLRNDNEGLPVSPVDRYDVRYAKMRERYYELGATLTHLVSR